MEKLPLIESEYPLFSWEESNGNATAEQTQKAYKAITSKGETSDFSRFVWNDLVDKVGYAVAESGGSWASAYASLAETKVKSKYDALTAKKFNSVALNIENLINTKWKWACKKDVQGYLGRSRVLGVSEVGEEKSDIVYGWYIEELARVTNVLLQILKNEANFGEFTYQQSEETLTNATLRDTKAGRMDSLVLSKSTLEVEFLSVKSLRLLALEKAKAESDTLTELTPAKVARFLWTVGATANSCIDVGINKAVVETMDSQEQVESSVEARLKELLYAGRMSFKESSSSHAFSELLFKRFNETTASAVSASNASGDIDFKDSVRFETKFSSNTFSESRIRKTLPVLASANAEGKSNIIAEFICNLLAELLGSFTSSSSMNYAKINVLRNALMFYMDNSESMAEAETTLKTPKYAYTKTGTISKALSELYNLIPLYINTENIELSSSASKVKLAKPFFIESAFSSLSMVLTDIFNALPKLMNVLSGLESCSDSSLEKLEGAKIESNANSGSAMTGIRLLRRVTKRIDSTVKTASNAIATLSFYNVQPDYWCAPVQTGSNLHIHSVWTHHDEETNVHIGHKFLDAVQVESNLHIKSIYMEQNQPGNIDLRFKYYEPIQKNGNIYIRSIESLEKEK